MDQAIQRAYEFNTPILPPSTENILQTNWLAGFADANGLFSIFIYKSKAQGLNAIIPFRITHKNVELLSIIQTSLGGVIYQTTNEAGVVN